MTPSFFRRASRVSLAFLLVGVMAVALGAKLRLIRTYGSDVPTVDQWYAEARALLIPHFDHQLKLKYFWVPHNEHRIVFTRLLNLSLTEANGQWDPFLEMTVNALIHICLAGALTFLAWTLARGFGLVGSVLAIAALFVDPSAWENTLSGFQSAFYLLELATLAHLWLIVPARSLTPRWWAGFLCGLLALGTLASGFIAAAAALGALGVRVFHERKGSFADLLAAGLLGVLCLGGFLLVHPVPGAVNYKVASVGEWLTALGYALCWPVGGILSGCLLLQLPVLVLFLKRMAGRQVERQEWVLIGLAIWSWLQMAAQAYSRGRLGPLSKYCDLYTVGLVVNVLALARLCGPRPRIAALLLSLWLLALGAGLRREWTQSTEAALHEHARVESIERRHLRDFEVTGDRAALIAVPPAELPYPSAERLADVLSHPGLHPLLPAGFRAPVKLRPVAGAHGFVASGRAADPVWVALPDAAAFTSEWLPPSALPVLRLRYYLHGSALFYLESQKHERISVRPASGADSWQTMDLQRLTGEPVRLVARPLAGNTEFAFTDPVEMSRGSWLVQLVLQRSEFLIDLGLVALSIGLAFCFWRSGDPLPVEVSGHGRQRPARTSPGDHGRRG